MTRSERTRLVRTLLLGLTITAGVAFANRMDYLAPLERWCYDLRARYCQFFMPPPTDRVVHFDIDDQTLEGVGRFPWPRSKLAVMVDELSRAGSTLIAFDMLFPEADLPAEDADFARAIGEAGNVLLPVSLKMGDPLTQRQRVMADRLVENLELDYDQLIVALPQKLRHNRATAFGDYLAASRIAIEERLRPYMDSELPSVAQMKRNLLPNASDGGVENRMTRLLEEQYDRLKRMRLLREFSAPTPLGIANALTGPQALAPVVPLAEVAALTATVDHLPENDGVLRSLPLMVEHNGQLYPHLGLALAMHEMGCPIDQLEVTPDRVVLNGRDGRREIPVHSVWSGTQDREVGLILDLPWFGNSQWESSFDWPDHREHSQHVPLVKVWEIRQTEEKIERNNQVLDSALKHLWVMVMGAPDKADQWDKNPPPLADFEARKAALDPVMAEAGPLLDPYLEIDPATLSDDEKGLLGAYRAARQVRQQNPLLLEQLDTLRADLAREVRGKVALIGYTSTGAVADVVNTSLHARCPGVVIHGVLFNAIMTDHLWTRMPTWVTGLITLGLGVAMTLTVALMAPGRALAIAAILGGGYALVNGVVAFDYGDTIVGAAAPLVVVGLTWSSGTLYRFVVERAERARITRRFSSYVDPALVSYVIEHPEQARLDGQEREMSVVFTDLAGFTTLSEALGASTVPLLNEYLGVMVPIIREHGGYVNKFLGDGVMFFYGAPLTNERHAVDAVDTVIQMQDAMKPFNDQLTARDLPNVAMRVGVASGKMIVGDAGTTDASDYTVLGDTVNLSARLESANKQTGTWILINQRTRELIGDRFLFRPVAKLQVVGKSEGIMTYEPMAVTGQATDEQRRLAEMTAAMVDAYLAGDFKAALAAADELEAAFEQKKLVALYRAACQHHLANPPGPDFDGHIVLESK